MGILTDTEEAGGWQDSKKVHLPKICHTYPAMMKQYLFKVILYLKKIQKIYESRDTNPGFCWHQHFFSENQQISFYQEIQILYFDVKFLILLTFLESLTIFVVYLFISATFFSLFLRKWVKLTNFR